MKASHAPPFVAYYRVSTVRQGQSGLGLDAQRAAVAAHIAHAGAPLVAEFTEIETGTKKRHRPELERALLEARRLGATLVIAKLDRLARNVAFLSALMDGDVPFKALDLPGANKFTLHVLAAVAEKEASDISERTKAALAAAKARGVRLGSPRNYLDDGARARGLEVRRARARERLRLAMSLVQAWRLNGWTIPRMAAELTALRVPQPRPPKPGRPPRPWHFSQVAHLLTFASQPPPPDPPRIINSPVAVPAVVPAPTRTARRTGRAPVAAQTAVPVTPTRTVRPARTRRPRPAKPPKPARPVADETGTRLTARFFSRCGRCGCDIWDGEPIWWAQGKRPIHDSLEACRLATLVATTSPAPVPELTVAERWETFERVGRLLEAQTFAFARTMPKNPHFYTLRRQWADDADFVWAVEQIRRLGYRQRFGGEWYTQLDVNAHFYWTMGAPINFPNGKPCTILINRKVRPRVQEAAPRPPAAVHAHILAAVGVEAGPLLDVAYGLPAAAERTFTDRLASFVPPAGVRFDRLVARGPLTADEHARLPQLLRPGGRAVVLVEGDAAPPAATFPGEWHTVGVRERVYIYNAPN